MAETNQFLEPTKPGSPIKGPLLFWTRERKPDPSDPPTSIYRAIQRGPVYDRTVIAPSRSTIAPAPAPITVSESTKVLVGCNQLYIEEVEIDVIEPGTITIRVLFDPPETITPPASPRSPSAIHSATSPRQRSPRRESPPPHPEEVYKRDRYIMADEKGQLVVGQIPQHFRVGMMEGRQVLLSEDGGIETVWRDRGLKGWHMSGDGETLWCKLLKPGEDQRGSRKAPGWRPDLEWWWR